MTYRDTPTCETGFWEPLHAGCPICGPSGPCIDPGYEKHIREHAESKRFRRTLLAVSAVVLIASYASGMEARQGGDAQQAPSQSDDSPTRQGDAQSQPPTPQHKE